MRSSGTAMALLASMLLVGSCVSQNTWTPTVDTYGDPNAWRLSHALE